MIAKAPITLLKCVTIALGTVLLAAQYSSLASALEPGKDEKKHLKACERQLCKIIVGKQPTGPDLSCALKKTWSKKTLTQGNKKGKKSRVSWLFGDAQCQTNISLSRAAIISAVSGRKFKLWLPPQTVNCKVVRSDKIRPVTIVVEPEIKFKNGVAKKVWLNVRKVDGPSDVKGLIWTVAKLEDSIGIFHRPMIKQINKFIQQKCPKAVSGN